MAKSGRRVRPESEAGSVVVSLQRRNYLWQNLEEGCGLKARLGVCVCVCVCVWGGGGGPFNGVTIYGRVWKKGAG